MPEDYNKPRGSTKGSRPDAGGANIRSVPVFGIVKDNIDPNRSGRLRVYISDFSGRNPDDSDRWVTVSYMSNFFGSVRPSSGDTDFGTYKANPASYGEWHAPPDIGTTVICIFINGDMNYGFYIGCVPDPETLHMVPAVGATLENRKNPNSSENVVFNNEESTTYGGSSRIPVTNMNTNNRSISDSARFLNQPKPAHSYVSAVMMQQGVIRDPIRGPISSSSQREPTSRVGWGVSTPGRPIYEGGYDDETVANAKNVPPEGLRIVSRSGGHSIVMDDGDVEGTDQLIRIRTAKGHQITMSDDGQTLTILHANGQSYVELGKEGTIDMYATNSVNIRTLGDLNLHADNNVNIHAEKDLNIYAENMNVQTKKALKQSVGTNYLTSALGLLTLKTVGAMSLSSVGPASFASTFTTFINGAIINLNTGKTPIQPLSVTPVPLTAHTDTIFDQSKGFTAAPGTLLSVTSRAPAHMPWAHAGQGVDLKIDLTGASKLPSSPSSLVSGIVKEGLSKGLPSIKLPTALSVPSIKTISTSITQSATNALVAVTGQGAALGPLKDAVQQGTAIVNTSLGKIAAVGTFALTPQQLMDSGVLKPGSDKLIDSLVSSGANITQAMPSMLFAGSPGAESLQNYVTNIQPQTDAVVKNLQNSETALRSAGIITGNEAPEQIVGIIYSGAQSGVNKTIIAIETSINKNTPVDSVINDIGIATSSTVLVTAATNGVNSLTESVNALNSYLSGPEGISTNTGVTGDAFAAITNSFPVFPPGVPINLLTGVSAQKIASDAIAGITSQSSAAILNSAQSVASGVVNLPGGFDAISSFKDLSLTKLPLPGAEKLSTLINTSATNAINGITSSASSIVEGITGSASSIVEGVTGSASSIVEGITGSLSNFTATLSLGSVMNITSAISSVKALFGGKGGVRTPSVAVNTVNREPVDNKVTQLLGDSKIPSPKYTKNNIGTRPSAPSSNNESFTDLDNQVQALNVQIIRLKQTEGAQILQEEQSKPAGDIDIQKRKDEILSRLNKLIDKRNELEQKRDSLIG